ncbi:recombinase family protein [Paenibacillus sp. BR1-192]|uniref:recombinase family protein n=1 Tax=Paenibacillus sp. BR1-192 TaxID=3032287 RepID=UPI00240D2938|nr:recombinase family protein [Paenibacillus sp. BR1-192]WFB57517.1 recombinase family protein [Paenibacillus sp. BR1-192]
MKVAIYIRVSTEDQAREGYSIRGQKKDLTDYCRSNSLEVANIYIDDGYSAKDTNRPKLKEMLKAAANNEFKAILVYKLDRFTRSVRDLYDLLEKLNKFGVGFISKQEKFDTTTAMGRAMIGILGVFAQFERETTAERVRMGMVQKALEGKKPGGKYPYGYDEQGSSLPKEFSVLRQLRALYMEGLSYQSIAAHFTRLGIKRRRYNWTANTVALTLENPFYAGIIRFGSKLPNGKYPQRKREERVDVVEAEGSHEAVWTIEEFNEHIELMRRRSTGGFGRINTYWFNGVLRCGRCGSAMYGRLTTKRSLKDGTAIRSAYYWCSRRKENKSCDMPMFRQTHVEHLIFEHVKKIITDNELIDSDKKKFAAVEQKRQDSIKSLEQDIKKVNARIDKWQYAFAEEIISLDDLKKRMDEEKKSLDILNAKLDKIKDSNKPQINDTIFNLPSLWKMTNDEEKQDIVCAIFKKITLHTEERNVKGKKNTFFPATAEIEYR